MQLILLPHSGEFRVKHLLWNFPTIKSFLLYIYHLLRDLSLVYFKGLYIKCWQEARQMTTQNKAIILPLASLVSWNFKICKEPHKKECIK